MTDLVITVCIFVAGMAAGLCLKGLADCDLSEDIYDDNDDEYDD